MKIVSDIKDIFANVPMNIMAEESSATARGLHLRIIPSSHIDSNFIFPLALRF
jgi:hypothetical protein